MIITYSRQAPFSDVQKVIRSLSKAEYHFLSPRGRYFDSPHLKARVVAYDDKKAVAFISGYVYKDAPDTMAIDFAVSPKARHKGLMISLIQRVIAAKGYMDFHNLYARVIKVNIPAQRLLEKFGFRRIRESDTYFHYTFNVDQYPIHNLWDNEVNGYDYFHPKDEADEEENE